jgi:hypothetical protein
MTSRRGWANRLEKTDWKRIIDLALYLLFCALAGVGFLLACRLPHTVAEEVTRYSLVLAGIHGGKYILGLRMRH